MILFEILALCSVGIVEPETWVWPSFEPAEQSVASVIEGIAARRAKSSAFRVRGSISQIVRAKDMIFDPTKLAHPMEVRHQMDFSLDPSGLRHRTLVKEVASRADFGTGPVMETGFRIQLATFDGAEWRTMIGHDFAARTAEDAPPSVLKTSKGMGRVQWQGGYIGQKPYGGSLFEDANLLGLLSLRKTATLGSSADVKVFGADPDMPGTVVVGVDVGADRYKVDGTPADRFYGYWFNPSMGWAFVKQVAAVKLAGDSEFRVIDEIILDNWRRIGADWLPTTLSVKQNQMRGDGRFGAVGELTVHVDDAEPIEPPRPEDCRLRFLDGMMVQNLVTGDIFRADHVSDSEINEAVLEAEEILKARERRPFDRTGWAYATRLWVVLGVVVAALAAALLIRHRMKSQGEDLP